MAKPIVIDRPWWRHPAFPWGWYSLRRDIPVRAGMRVEIDGCINPGDDGNGTVFTFNSCRDDHDGGAVITPTGGDGDDQSI